ncbi:bacteriophage tail sheath protein [hydrocarbon metagenome]|uniref:Bacteriophage tail sheath protein n=1 Tax=hydrocarbon metagenome TaxID=938273 RepID=A0A0W8FUI6_9ZZZZ
MVRAAIKANPYLDLTVCALDDSASTPVARVHTLAIGGPATGSGTLTLWVGNVRYQIGIASTDAASAIATALKAALDNDPALPFTVAIDTATLTFTAKNKGTVANQIDFAVEITATSVTGTFTATTPGSVDPTLATALAAVFSGDYNIIAVPFYDATSYAAFKTHLDSVSGPMEQRPAIGVFGYDGVLADCTTLTSTINSGRILCAYLRGTKSPAYEIGAALAAVIASEEDPARPLNTLELTGIAAPAISDRLSRSEQESCLGNGATPLEVGPGEVVQIVRAVSTYVHNAQGVDDIALLDITTIRTLDYVRKSCRERVALRFPREKLSSKTPDKVRDQLLDVLFQLEALEIVEEVTANADGVIVERDIEDTNRLNAKIPVDVVNGLHVFAGRIDLLL